VIYSVVLDGDTYFVHANTDIGEYVEYRYPTGFWFRESAEQTIYDLEEGFALFNPEEWIRL
jgi:hypothetical protein